MWDKFALIVEVVFFIVCAAALVGSCVVVGIVVVGSFGR